MPDILIPELIEQLIKSRLTATNLSPYEPRLNVHEKFKKVPYSVYFYYVKFIGDNLIDVTRYHHQQTTPILEGEIEGIITTLARNARAGGSKPLPAGKDFEETWDRISYIAILMDEVNFNFVRYGPNLTSIIFNLYGTNLDNHSFFDAADFKVDMTGNDTEFRSCLYLINHMKKNLAGDELGDTGSETQTFDFSLFYWVQTSTGKKYKWIQDPTGTNLGPPVPPP